WDENTILLQNSQGIIVVLYALQSTVLRHWYK
ncbi:MAG: hypothetical protein RLZZ70_410, partial [Candidatus Parcubacteria bacterium]